MDFLRKLYYQTVKGRTFKEPVFTEQPAPEAIEDPNHPVANRPDVSAGAGMATPQRGPFDMNAWIRKQRR